MSCFISTASRLAVAVARTGLVPPRALDQHVGEEQVAVDEHRRDVRDVHRVLAPADDLRREVDDACRRDRHLCREPEVAAAESAGAKYVRAPELAALGPEKRGRRQEQQPSDEREYRYDFRSLTCPAGHRRQKSTGFPLGRRGTVRSEAIRCQGFSADLPGFCRSPRCYAGGVCPAERRPRRASRGRARDRAGRPGRRDGIDFDNGHAVVRARSASSSASSTRRASTPTPTSPAASSPSCARRSAGTSSSCSSTTTCAAPPTSITTAWRGSSGGPCDARPRLHRRPSLPARREARRDRVQCARRTLAASVLLQARSPVLFAPAACAPLPLAGRKIFWQTADRRSAMIVLADADVVLPDRILGPGTVVIDGDRIVDVLAAAPARSGGDAHFDLRGHTSFLASSMSTCTASRDRTRWTAGTRSPGSRGGCRATASPPSARRRSPARRALRELLDGDRRRAPAAGLPAPRACCRRISRATSSTRTISGAQPLDCLRLPPARVRRAARRFHRRRDPRRDRSGAAGRRHRDACAGARRRAGPDPRARARTDIACRSAIPARRYEQAIDGIEAGARHATHLFNRMPPITIARPAWPAAVLEHDEIAAEIICDGVHVHPAMVRLAIAAKSPLGVMAITDGTAGSGLPRGSTAVLGGRTITVRRRRLPRRRHARRQRADHGPRLCEPDTAASG